jgi:putative transposase
MDTHTYLTDLSAAKWRLLEPLLPSPARIGRPRRHSLRTIMHAILYLLRAGRTWRLLPAELPPWRTVFKHLCK